MSRRMIDRCALVGYKILFCMVIPSHLPQFKSLPTLISAVCANEAHFYIARDGVIVEDAVIRRTDFLDAQWSRLIISRRSVSSTIITISHDGNLQAVERAYVHEVIRRITALTDVFRPEMIILFSTAALRGVVSAVLSEQLKQPTTFFIEGAYCSSFPDELLKKFRLESRRRRRLQAATRPLWKSVRESSPNLFTPSHLGGSVR